MCFIESFDQFALIPDRSSIYFVNNIFHLSISSLVFHPFPLFLSVLLCSLLQVLIKEGSLPALVGSINSRELNCQRYSSLCLANLATTVAAQVKIIQCGAVRPLINLALNPNNQIEARRYAVLALASMY
jgi:hypothetical protein